MQHASFSSLALYHACPLKYRYLEVDRTPEPRIPPDWRRAPERGVATIASDLDRRLGAVVHLALLRWQRGVDAGAPPRVGVLLEAVAAGTAVLGDAAAVKRALDRVRPGLTAYAEGPWPRRATLFLEQRTSHRLTDSSGFTLELALRVDRVVRYQRAVAILDFKTVSPHAFELAVDEWQLRTYALAAPELVGVEPQRVRLFLIDLRAAEEIPVASTAEALSTTAGELLGAARGVAAADFAVEGVPHRPCWACGFRLTCPASLARDAPRAVEPPD